METDMQQQSLKEIFAIAVLAVAASISWLLAFVAVPLAAA
jgi:hypothetical protein